MECHYALMTFGINMESFPVDTDGTQSLVNHQKWILKRKLVDEEKAAAAERSVASGIILYPSTLDIVLGRGRPYQEYPGNLRLHEIIKEHTSWYEDSDRLTKTAISRKIVHAIKESDGRFLEKLGEDGVDGWQEVNDEMSRERVSRGIRNATRNHEQDE
jgi:hypothetical protein